MPRSVSRAQYRLMQAIRHGYKNDRTPPPSVAEKYTEPGPDSPDSKHNNRGGKWRNKGDKRDKRHKKDMRKSFEDGFHGRGAGVIIANENGEILAGKDANGQLSFPGGHIEHGESFEEGVKREAKEEAGINVEDVHEIGMFRCGVNDSKVFYAKKWNGKPKSNDGELKDLKFFAPDILVDQDMRPCCKESLKLYFESSFKKSLKDEIALEKLSKNVMRGADGRTSVLDVSHGDALKLVGNGLFRFIQKNVSDMQDESFKDFHLDTYKVSVRKHLNDVYSGRVYDGQKLVHQFTNKSLPMLTADLMSVFEWYNKDDENVIDHLLDSNMHDDVIHGGLDALSDNYRKHNLANIYEEVENLRRDIRNNVSVDVQQVESRIMGLFDKLERVIQDVSYKHNELCDLADHEFDELEQKLRALQAKVDELSNKSSTVEAYSAYPVAPDKVYNREYFYLPKPQITIEPNGRIKITFDPQWSDLDKENFLGDMKAKVVRKRNG